MMGTRPHRQLFRLIYTTQPWLAQSTAVYTQCEQYSWDNCQWQAAGQWPLHLHNKLFLPPDWQVATATWLAIGHCHLMVKWPLPPDWQVATATWLASGHCHLTGQWLLPPGWQVATATWLASGHCHLTGKWSLLLLLILVTIYQLI